MVKRLCFLILIVCALSACGRGNSSPSPTMSDMNANLSSPTEIADSAQPLVHAAPIANWSRAAGKGKYGELLVIPSEKEEVQPLGAPSCMGGEQDYSFKSDYSLVFKNDDGEEQEIGRWKETTIVSGSKTEPREIQKLTFDDAELFYFQPVRNACRADAIYFYFIGENAAFQASFDVENNRYDQFSQVPQAEPYVDHGKLVLESTEGDRAYKYIFSLDGETFILDKKEAVD